MSPKPIDPLSWLFGELGDFKVGVVQMQKQGKGEFEKTLKDSISTAISFHPPLALRYSWEETSLMINIAQVPGKQFGTYVINLLSEIQDIEKSNGKPVIKFQTCSFDNEKISSK